MDGVILTPLRQISHDKGDILHAMKCTDSGYSGFGEAYFSSIKKGEVKGWKKHTEMTMNIIVPVGEIEFVIFDDRTEAFEVVTLSRTNYQRLTVRPELWMAFRGLGNDNLLLNLASLEHHPDEATNKTLQEIEYAW